VRRKISLAVLETAKETLDEDSIGSEEDEEV
jgi:hypothetical protein